MNNTTFTEEFLGRTGLNTKFPPPETLGFKIPKITVYCAILLVCTTGNAMVIAVILSSKRMRSLPSNILILNLAFADLLTLIISVPFDVVLEENHYVWPYGAVLCKLLFPAATLLSTSSSLTLAAISLDRYRTLLHPFKPKLSVTQINLILAVVDCFSVLLVVPYAVFLGIQNSFCTEEWPEFLYRQIYTVFLVSVQYVLPLGFMIIMYILASAKLYSTTKSVRKLSTSTEDGRRTSLPFRDSLARKKSFVISQEQNARATKMFVIIVVAFAVCTLPNQVLWLWVDFGKNGDVTSLAKEVIICRFFTYTNGCVNPIIFFMFRRDYRQGLNKLVRKITRREPETDSERMQRLWRKVDLSHRINDTMLLRQRKLGTTHGNSLVDNDSISSSCATRCKKTHDEELHECGSSDTKSARKTYHIISTATAERKHSGNQKLPASWF